MADEETNTNQVMMFNNEDYSVNYTEAEGTVGKANTSELIFLGAHGTYNHQSYTDGSSTKYLMQFYDPEKVSSSDICYYLDKTTEGFVRVTECSSQPSFICIGPAYHFPEVKIAFLINKVFAGIIGECFGLSNQIYTWKPVIVEVDNGEFSYCVHDIHVTGAEVTSINDAKVYCRTIFTGELLQFSDEAEVNLLAGIVFEPFDEILPIKFSMRLTNYMVKDLNKNVSYVAQKVLRGKYVFDGNGECLALVRVYGLSKDYLMPVRCNRTWKHLTCKTGNYKMKRRMPIKDRKNPQALRLKLNSNLQVQKKLYFSIKNSIRNPFYNTNTS
uniref:Ig-like domain-containing protein n=1 Tax=Syphacia muris TaxID=451379 RepID=A0A0N5AY58_9BILA